MSDIIAFIRGASQDAQASLKFKDKSVETFEKSVICWLADRFNENTLYVMHNGNNLISVFIKSQDYTYEVKINLREFVIVATMLTKPTIFRTDDPNIDFWTICGPTAVFQKMTNTAIVNYGYIGGETYTELFFNEYGIHHDIIADILRDVVVKRKYVEQNGIWMDMEELFDLTYDEPCDIDIYGTTKTCSQDDLCFLVFQALVALILEYHHGVIAYEYITCVAPGHFRVGDPMDYDKNEMLTVCDYIIENNKLLVRPTLVKDIGDMIVWRQYGPRLYRKMNCACKI